MKRKEWLILAIGVVGLIVGIGGVLLVVLTRDDGNGATSDSSKGNNGSALNKVAGEPLPSETARRLLSSANLLTGGDLQIESDTGRCEVVYRVTRIIASRSSPRPTGSITEANAAAAASPNGSLYLTVDQWTGGDPEALSAVEECWPYLVGKPF